MNKLEKILKKKMPSLFKLNTNFNNNKYVEEKKYNDGLPSDEFLKAVSYLKSENKLLSAK